MYRLTVIAGPQNAQPSQGDSFSLDGDRVSIGRHSTNEIVLRSGNVSKKHCVLVVDHGRLILQDQGSSNGTFVNGKLSSERDVYVGDRISVGEFVFEITQMRPAKHQKPSRAMTQLPSAQILSFPTPAGVSSLGSISSSTPPQVVAVAPRDPIGKAKFFFEKYVMPYFYSFNEKYEWRFVALFMIFAFILINLFVSVSPLLSKHEKALDREMSKRAQVMAREIAERNTSAISLRQESKTEIGVFAKEEAVRSALIIDLKNRIIAPAERANRYFTEGAEAEFSVKARDLYLNGYESGIAKKINSETIAAIEPIKVFNPQQGRNNIIALAVVTLDTTLANPSAGEMSLVYSHVLVITALFAFLIFYILYRVTLKPFEVMNERIDQALRGENVEFQSPVYFSEVDSLWDIVDSALKRIPKGDSVGGGFSSGGETSSYDFLNPLKSAASFSKEGVLILDGERNIFYINAILEEITGIRLDASEGQTLDQASRDQAFTVFIQDLVNRSMVGSEGIVEEFEFSGATFSVHCVVLGSMGSPQCYLINFKKADG